MRVNFFPSLNNEKPEIYFALNLGEKAIDYLLDSKFRLVSQFDGASEVRDNIQRFRIQSPGMLLTCCQGQARKPELSELQGIVDLLSRRELDGAKWEIQIPTNEWAIDEDDDTPFDMKDLLQSVAAEVNV